MDEATGKNKISASWESASLESDHYTLSGVKQINKIHLTVLFKVSGKEIARNL